MPSICPCFSLQIPLRRHNISNALIFANSWRRKIDFLPLRSSSSSNDDSASSLKQNQLGYDPSEELIGLGVDHKPRHLDFRTPKPRSWFGPSGQYIRELPCPDCRGRGYTPCAECGIETSRSDCDQCNGKGMMTCVKCLGECVIWEESIDEKPWEQARSISPFKVKEDDEVDNLDIKLDDEKKSKRVYKSPSPEVGLKISRSLKSLNAKTGLFSKRMKILHADPEFQAAIKKAKGAPGARKRISKALKEFFSDPENRLKRSISMKGVKFFCRNCGREGHRSFYCPEDSSRDKRWKCGLCGKKGHNRRTCLIGEKGENSDTRCKCRLCGKKGHNRRTCLIGEKGENSERKPYQCRLCRKRGHNARTCPKRKKIKPRYEEGSQNEQ